MKNKRRTTSGYRRKTKSLALPVKPASVPAYPPQIATILIDPDSLFRDGLTRILADTQFRISASAPSAEGFDFKELCNAQAVLFVIGAGDDPKRSIKELERCRQLCPSARVLILGDTCSGEALEEALKAGANAYLIRTMVTTEILLKSLDLVLLGETVLSSSILHLLCGLIDGADKIETTIVKAATERDDLGSHRLSTREIETLSCLMEGYSNKLIARRFDIAEATVKVHIKAILRKIRVENRTQAAIWAMTHLPSCMPVVNGNGSHSTAVGAAFA